MVLATGLPFETVAEFMQGQLIAVHKAMQRHWELTAALNGIQAKFGVSESVDQTSQFEKKVEMMKKQTGRTTFDLREVI